MVRGVVREYIGLNSFFFILFLDALIFVGLESFAWISVQPILAMSIRYVALSHVEEPWESNVDLDYEGRSGL